MKSISYLTSLLFIFLNVYAYIAQSQVVTNIEKLEKQLEKANTDSNLVILDSLWTLTIKEDVNRAMKYSKQMLNIGVESSNDLIIQQAYNKMAGTFYEILSLDSAFYYVSKAIEFYDETNDEIELARSYALLSDINYYEGKHELGVENLFKAIDIYKKKHKAFKLAKAYKDLSLLYSNLSNFEKTIEYSIKALEYFEKKHDSLNIADTYRILSGIYGVPSLNDLLNQQKYILRAISYLNNYRDNRLYFMSKRSLAGIYSRRGIYDSAFLIYNELLSYYEKNDDSLKIASTNLEIANNLMRFSLDSIKPAVKAYQISSSIYKILDLKKYVRLVEYNLGEAYYAVYNYDSAVYYLNKTLELSKKNEAPVLYRQSLMILIKVYEETGDYKKAFSFLNKYKNYSDSVEIEKTKVKVAELETKYETAKKEQQIKELQHQQEIEKKEKLVQLIILGSVILAVILILIFVIQKRKKDRQIHKQKELVHQKEKELSEAELEKRKIKEEELQQSVLYKSKQLSTHALHMMQKNTMLQEIQKSLKELAKKAPLDEKPNYKQLTLQIKQSLQSDKEWDVFKLYFEDVNKGFYNKLNEINPELTTYDHRICALIKLNMTSKEMASVLNIAPSSIKSARYRLKKKLNLDVDADLEEFIRKIE